MNQRIPLGGDEILVETKDLRGANMGKNDRKEKFQARVEINLAYLRN